MTTARPCWPTEATSARRSTTARSCATVSCRPIVCPIRCWPSSPRSTQPVEVEWAGAGFVSVTNRRWFTALDDLRATWVVEVDGRPVGRGVLDLPPIAPQQQCRIAGPPLPGTTGGTVAVTFTFRSRRPTAWAARGSIEAVRQILIEPETTADRPGAPRPVGGPHAQHRRRRRGRPPADRAGRDRAARALPVAAADRQRRPAGGVAPARVGGRSVAWMGSRSDRTVRRRTST